MTILVTGGAGFIGSHFIHHTRKTHPHDRIVCLDKLTYAGDLRALAPLTDDPRFRFIQGDICDRETVFRMFEEEHPALLFHFAAESHVDRSIDDPSLFLKTNILGTQVLLDACRTYGITRYHQVSTDEVYGDLPTEKEAAPFTESAPLAPSNPYAASKAGADLLVLSYRRTYGLPVSISRGSNTYGPHQYPEKLIPRMIRLARQNSPLPLYGDGEQRRDWLYVEDHCRAIDLIARKGREGEIYNIGGGHEMRNIDLVKLLCRLLEKPETLITHAPDRPGHDRRYALDFGKLQSELGWRPETDFAVGLQATVHSYLNTPPR